jgi:hypothetical protein
VIDALNKAAALLACLDRLMAQRDHLKTVVGMSSYLLNRVVQSGHYAGCKLEYLAEWH